MNATVTRSATKNAAAKSATKKVATSPAKAPKAKSPGKTASKLTKTISGVTAPTKKTTVATPKTVAKPAKTTVKSNAAADDTRAAVSRFAKAAPVKAAAAQNAVPAAARAAGAKNTAPAASKTAPVLKRGTRASTEKTSSKEASGSSMSGNNAGAGLTDTMETSVVSKVSEVATKTTKPTPAAPAGGALLTEEQILKMSDDDYMNEAQLAFFKARLQQLERDLLKNADETTEHLRETVLVPDPADRATIEEEHALELRTRDRERKLLKKVQQAIASIDAGEYGWCEETGEPIGIPRLLARPTATLSLEAQQRRELKQKLYGD
nr:RNA polymerase-binding protein DksA [Noviherbaspirillum autotrophicum]